MTKTAFIAIVGSPNVGKSYLLNSLLGQKLAIVSSKPQTTRTKIMGILTKEDTQLVFIDTPGFHKPRTKLGEKMVKAVSDSIAGVDACLFVVDAKIGMKEADKELLDKIKAERIPLILALNKIDTLQDKSQLIESLALFDSLHNFEALIPTSATKGINLDELEAELMKLAQPSGFFFPEDTLTDQPERVIAAEMIREKMLRLLNEEIPHGIAVEVESMREREDSDLMDIDAVIYCEKESHKGIIIGKQGSMLKKISTFAREDMEEFFMCRVNLQCWVKVKRDWRNREGLIRSFGLD